MDLIPGLIGGLLLVLVCRRARLGPEVAFVVAGLASWLLAGRVPGVRDTGPADAAELVSILLLPVLFRVGSLVEAKTPGTAPVLSAARVLARVSVRLFFCAAAMYLWIFPSDARGAGGTIAAALVAGAILGIVGPSLLSSSTPRAKADRPSGQHATRDLLVGLLVLQFVASGWHRPLNGLGVVGVSVIAGVAMGFLGGMLHRYARDGLSRTVIDLASALAALQISALCGHALGAYSPDLATVLIAGVTRKLTSAGENAGRPESLREEGFWNATTLVASLTIIVAAGARYPDLFRLTEAGLVISVWLGVVLLQGLLTFALDYGASPSEGAPAWRSSLYASSASQPGVFVLGGALVFALVDEGAAIPAVGVRVIAQVVLLSLLVRGVSRSWLMRFCFPGSPESVRTDWEYLEARRVALRAGLDRLLDLREETRVSDVPFETIRRGLTRELNEVDAERTVLRTEHPEIERHAWNQVLQDVLEEARAALEAARDRGEVSAEAAREFEAVLSHRWFDAARSSVEDALGENSKPGD